MTHFVGAGIGQMSTAPFIFFLIKFKLVSKVTALLRSEILIKKLFKLTLGASPASEMVQYRVGE